MQSVVFAILFTLVNISIHSQTGSSSNEGRFVTYKQLNEFAKYVAFKDYADSLIMIKDSIILAQEQSIHKLTDVVARYELSVIPNLNTQIKLLNDQISENEKLYAIREEEHRIEIAKIRRKRITVGPYAGYGATPQNLQPSIGIALSYAIFRL